MVALGEKWKDDLAAGVVGVGDEEDRLLEQAGNGKEHLDELVEQAAPTSVRGDQPLVDPADERDAKHLSEQPLHEQSDSLEGVPRDVRGLGIVGGLLVKVLDGGGVKANVVSCPVGAERVASGRELAHEV